MQRQMLRVPPLHALALPLFSGGGGGVGCLPPCHNGAGDLNRTRAPIPQQPRATRLCDAARPGADGRQDARRVVFRRHNREPRGEWRVWLSDCVV